MPRLLLALLWLLPLAVAAQSSGGSSFGFEYRPNVAQVVQGPADTLRLAFAGGLNTPQFSPIDLNGDQQADLYAFDRLSGRSFTFLNVAGVGGGRAWQYAPDYESIFPVDLFSWALLRDYDCDGRPDLFTFAPGGDVRVFRNVPGAADGRPSFVLTTSQLRYGGTGPGAGNLITGAYNLPAIQDVNGDGRLDILTFEYASSSTLELYLNDSPACGGLSFALSSAFWGGLRSCGCTTYSRPGVSCRPTPPAPNQTAHTPSHSALLLDVDGNGTLDFLAGADNCDQLATLLNDGPSAVSPSFGPAAGASPFAAAAVPVLPSAYVFDANFDGRPDVVVAPNMLENDEDLASLRASVRLFENTAAAGAAPAYQLAARPFLQGDMLDVSEQAAPALADVDGDGRLDMLVGNLGEQAGVGSGAAGYRASLRYFRNVGTARRPVFRLVTDDYLGLAARGLTHLRPAFADLNADGTLDLVYGATTPASGAHAFYFRLNAAPAGQPVSFATAPESTLQGAGLPTQPNDTAGFFDVDNDGFVDVLVGTNEPAAGPDPAAGALRYFRNRGTGPLASRFELAEADFGRVRTAAGERPGSLAPVVADFNGDGQPDLLTVDGSGDAQLFANVRGQRATGGAFAGRAELFFNALTGQLEPARQRGGGFGAHPAATAADLDGDGRPELLVGTETGGLLSYGGRGTVLASHPPQFPTPSFGFNLYPNPTRGQLTVELPAPARIEVLDLTGRRVRAAVALPAGRPALELRGLAPGVYLLRATAANGSSATRRLTVE
ncbi:FG-GAP-like repeat-containing protein [uncultured Hymenobacter sp.]|uniref:FG-GAP-like repeat-containing protein n=1 Tax=uncultured Hymenobacter sp. TaxID=170016 RepID=UPI0035C9FB73